MHPLLAVGTKCSIPRLPEALVRRPRLERLLADDVRRNVTLVSAPPGAGKTTLLTSWLAGTPGGPVAWVTLDERDGWGDRLAALVAVALDRAGALGEPSLADAADLAGDAVLDLVFERVMRRGQRCVLVLDDLQDAHGPSAQRALGHIVEQAPALLDVVMATRADPSLGWGRLRLDGRLCQIRNDELRFSPDEAAELFARHGVSIGRADTRVLCDRTEGWAAGLRLAACALQSGTEPQRFVLSASATQVAVSDYLLTEVLDRQDEGAQQFLLRTSVVDRLTPGLATALTGDEHAGERLAALERKGIFVVELDGDGNYRYHALFAALLRARLRLRDPELATGLHRRAARWHLAHGDADEAEAHARLAGEWYLVGRLALDRWYDSALRGTAPRVDPTAGAPPVVVLGTPELALVAAGMACRRGDRAEADQHRRVVDHAGTRELDRGPTWPLARAVLDLEYARAFGPSTRARHAARLLEGTDRGPTAAPARRLARLRRAQQDIDAGHLERARHDLDCLAAEPAPDVVVDEATALLATLAAASGQLDRADELAAAVLTRSSPAEGTADAVGAAHLALGVSHAQRAEPRQAEESFAGIDFRPEAAPCRALVLAHHAARAAGRRRGSGGLPVLDEAPAEHALVESTLVALGVLESVDHRGRPRAHGGTGERAVAAARRATGHRRHQAMDVLAGWLDAQPAGLRAPGPPSHPHPRTLVEASVLCATYADERGDGEATAACLRTALRIVEPSGIRAPFAEHAERVVPLLRRHARDLGPHQGMALDLVDRLTTERSRPPVEPLTVRELEVLHHLPSLMSNVEIAADLHLSVNTVKSHLKAVYRKLGAEGRRQAVMRGRELELI